MRPLIFGLALLALSTPISRAADEPNPLDAPPPATPARPAATAAKSFDDSPAGKAALAKIRAAEARLARARNSGTPDERAQAAHDVLDARQAYRAAFQAAGGTAAKATTKPTAAAGAAIEPPPPNPAPMNAAILAFARENFGKQVGNGECWTLADKALKVAGAKAPDTYAWGRPLDPAKDEIIPGDVIQFTKARLETKDGRWFNLGTPQHTSIIEKVVSPGVYHVLHQNVGGKTVTEMTIDTTAKTAGDVVIYRPLPGNGYKADSNP
jgi:hypothetical protein